MTIASLIVEVGANVVKLQQDVEKINGQLDKVGSVASQMGKELAAAFTVTALVNFGLRVLDAGDRIQKMSDQTSLATDEVQRLDYIAGQTDSSVESLVGAVQNLQQRLGDDNSGAAGAMAKLGINADAFAKLGTYEQMTTLAEAIRGVKDPTEQASVSAQLFGKTWKEILPAIKSGMKDVGDQAPIMSDETVKALDRIGDAMTGLKQRTIVWGAAVVGWVEKAGFAFGDFLSKFDPEHLGVSNSQLLKMVSSLNDESGLYGALSKVKPAAMAVGDQIKAIGINSADAKRIGDELTESARVSIEVNKKHEEALRKTAEAIERFKNSVKSFSFGVFIEDTSKLNAQVPDLSGHMADMASRFADVREHMDDLESTNISFNSAVLESDSGVRKLAVSLSTLPNVAAQATKQIEAAGQQLQRSFGDRAVGILSDVDKILSNIPGKFAEIGAVAARAGQAIVKNLEQGDVLGALIAGATAAVEILGKLFGNNAEKKINPVREAFVQAAGGLAQLNERAHEAGVTLAALLNAKNPEAYTKAINELNAAFQFQDDAMKTLDETATKWGFTLAEVPEKFRQGKLDEQFLELYKDQKVLTAGGFEFDAILQKQVGSFQDLINVALQTGATIPEQLRPAVQRLIDLGLITDLAGEKLTDIGQLTFAETLDKKFSTLLDTINKLVDAITRGIGGAIASIPNDKTIHIGYQYDPYNPPSSDNFAAAGGFVTASGIQRFGGGGVVLPFAPRGSDTVPAMLTPGELVLNKMQQRSLLNGGGQSQAETVAELRQLRAELAEQRRSLPRAIRDAVLLAQNAA